METVVDVYFACNPEWNLFHHCFGVQHFIQNILAVAGRCINGICFLVISHHLIFRGCIKKTSNHLKHDSLSWQAKLRVGYVFPVLTF